MRTAEQSRASNARFQARLNADPERKAAYLAWKRERRRMNDSPEKRAKAVARVTEWTKENREKRSAYMRALLYGLNKSAFDAMLDAQGGRCAVCLVTLTRGRGRTAAHLDHDHKTGQPRGILCQACNLALGHLKDDVAILRRAVQYLERSADHDRMLRDLAGSHGGA